MTLSTPLALVLLLLAIPVAYIGWPRMRFRRVRDTVSLALRLIIVALLVLALSGAQRVHSSNRLAVVFLVDVSDSMGPAAIDAAYDFIRASLPAMGPDDVAGVVVFGSDAQVGRSLSALRELAPVRAVPETGNTDIAEAIRLGLALFPANAARRLVILSDGQPTLGDTQSAAVLAAAAGVQINYVPFTREPGPEIQVRDLRVPAVLAEDQQFDMIVTITARQTTQARINVLAAGEIVYSEVLTLRPGTNNYTLALISGEAGFRDFLVQVQPEGEDGFYQNNQMGAFTRVEGDPRVLVVASDPAETRYLIPALEESGLTVDSITPQQLPVGVAPLAQYNSIVLANVSALDLSISRMETLETYVGDLGGGLVVIGGPDSYGPGAYFQTPLEEVLPVEMQIRDQQRLPRLTIAYVIDRSGSMGQLSPRGIAYIDLAKEAIIRSIDFLQAADRAAVASFDFDAYWIAEFQDVVNGEELQRLVATLRPSGGTSILAGMRLVQNAIINEPSELKHIILLTDGGADSTGLVRMARELYEEHNVTTSVISIGEFEAPFLAEMASAGNGNYHHVIDADTIPNIFSLETVLATRSYIIEETFTPTAAAFSAATLHPIIRGLQTLPQLRGYIATTEREAAQVILRGPEPFGDPILAAWQYGLGRSVAFTSDATARWGANWITWEQYAGFWSQAVQWTMTEGAASNLEAQVIVENEQARIVVDGRDAAGGFLNGLDLQARVVFQPGQPAEQVALRQVAPGRYEGTFTPAGEGAHFIRITGVDRDGQPVNQTTGWVMTYSQEYNIREDDASVLEEIAAFTGGVSLAGAPQRAFDHTIRVPDATTPLWPWLLLAALLLLPFDIAVRRLIITRSDIRRLVAYVSRPFVAQPAGPDSAERLSTLKEARQRARRQVQAAAQGPETSPTVAPGAAQDAPAAGLSALRERRQQARAAVDARAEDEPGAAPGPVEPSKPRFTPRAPNVPEPIAPDSDANIGARLLKKRRGEGRPES